MSMTKISNYLTNRGCGYSTQRFGIYLNKYYNYSVFNILAFLLTINISSIFSILKFSSFKTTSFTFLFK